ncbi:MAG: hypothetical protein HUJ26_13155 [Planctomycetaceae bacterium]|nr:hypothetical protein [Planctomycetaceae bacterium]
MIPPLPEQLGYLKPFIRELEALPLEELNEDVDPTTLEEALRERLFQEDPEATLDADREALDDWLGSFDSNTHPAHWISGFLLSLTAADLLENDTSQIPEIPQVDLEAPEGWSLSNNGAELRKGKLLAVVLPIDELSFDLLQRQMAMPLPPQLQNVAQRTSETVTYGEANGQKYVYEVTGKETNRQVDYVLSVPGGYATIKVWGSGFDEKELESSFHTLKITQPKT